MGNSLKRFVVALLIVIVLSQAIYCVPGTCVAGEKKWEMEDERRRRGIPLDSEVYETLGKMGQEIQVEFNI